MRLFCRAIVATSLLSFLLVSAGFAKSPAKSKHRRLGKKSQMAAVFCTQSGMGDSAQRAPTRKATASR